MATPNRAALLTKMHKVLKKHYTPVPMPERPLLEHLLYACCLENASYSAADKAYAAVSTSFFDWNEVRVSTVKELAEAMHMLPEPQAAAANLKRILQSVFESAYAFEIEALKKQNLGQAQQTLAKYEGATPFGVAYVTQAALGGHSIPLDRGLLAVFAVLGLASEQDQAAHTVPGLERAIPKNKGVEFGSLAHQLAAEMVANPYSPSLHKLLLEIAPDAKDQLPKRPAKGKPTDGQEPSKSLTAPSAAVEAPDKHADSAKSAAAKKPPEAKAREGTKPEAKHDGAKHAPEKHAPDKKVADKKVAEKKGAEKKGAEKDLAGAKKKSAAIGLSKRKPR
jgi:hypothetical protein